MIECHGDHCPFPSDSKGKLLIEKATVSKDSTALAFPPLFYFLSITVYYCGSQHIIRT